MGLNPDDVVIPNGPIVLCGGRQSGKTTRLIEMAEASDQYILEPTKKMADYVFRMARKMGKDIRYPVSVGECLRSDMRSTPYAMCHPNGGILVDEAQEVLRMALHLPRIAALAVCSEGFEIMREVPEWQGRS